MTTKQKNSYFLFLLAGLLLSMMFPSLVSFAQEGNGGAVQTNGHIGFYEETTTSSSLSDSSSTLPSTSQEGRPSGSYSSKEQEISKPLGGEVTKPAGKYPSTGELMTKSLSLSGMAILVVALILFWRHRRKGSNR